MMRAAAKASPRGKAMVSTRARAKRPAKKSGKQRGTRPAEQRPTSRSEPGSRAARKTGVEHNIKIDIVVESKKWARRRGVRAVMRRALSTAASTLAAPAAELAIVLSDDEAIRQLNHAWRGVDKATNVLSFPTPPVDGASRHRPRLLGDIILAYQTIAGEAVAEHKPFAHHLAHLTIHGFLHLLGYDHVRDGDAETMEQAERDILRRLAIPDPYRSNPKPAKPASRRRER